MNRNETKARSSLERAVILRDSGDVEGAIEELSRVRSSTYDGLFEECVEMLTELCLCADEGRHGDRLDLRNALNTIKRNNQNIEADTKRFVEMVFSKLRRMMDQMKANMNAMITNPSKEDQLVAALSGIPVEERARERYFLPCQHAAQKVGDCLFGRNGLSLSVKVLSIYLKSATEFVNTLHALGTKNAVVKTCYVVVDQLLRLIVEPTLKYADAKANHDDFMKSDTCGAETIAALCNMATILTAEDNWPANGWGVFRGLKRIADKLMATKEGAPSRSKAYEKMSDVLWECGVTSYHAYCLAIAARQRTDRTPTRAVLAALLCPQADERHNPFAPNYDSREVHQDIVELFDSPDISRSQLLNALQLDGSLTNADQLTQPLVQVFTAEVAAPSTDFAALHDIVSKLSAADAGCARYEKQLRQVLLRRQMEALASVKTRVNLQDLSQSTAKVSVEQYLRDVEPSFLQDSSLPIEIDAKTKSVIFRNSTRVKMFTSFTKLAASVDLGRHQPPRPIPSSSAAIAAITKEDLQRARRRAQALSDIQIECGKAAEKRKQDFEKKADEERVAKVRARATAEEERQAKAKETARKKLLAEYREAQRQERCKKVLEKLRIKYPHFKIDNAIVKKSANAFEDELTSALAAYKRREVDDDSRDSLRGNLFERALRKVEIPRRKELRASMAEQHKAERAAARQNNLIQHRKEFEKRQEERAVLQKFLPDAEAFVEKWQRAAGGEKVSKRDEQQQLLEQEKRRLAEQS